MSGTRAPAMISNESARSGLHATRADAPALKAYLKRHTEVTGREPDRWASPITYASLQVLQQAIERVGKLDRAAVIKEIHNGTFKTIIGDVKLKDGLLQEVWAVGQWQDGEFYGLAPMNYAGARQAVTPKSAWKAQ